MSRLRPKLAVAAAAAIIALLVSGCSTLGAPPWENTTPTATTTAGATAAAPTPIPTCATFPVDSVFSAYGVVHYSRVLAPNLTLYLDMWTEQKTHEWFAAGDKELNFVLRVVDANAQESDPFTLKRKVYMSEIVIEADTITPSGATAQALYQDLDPIAATLDPEALHSRYGLLITSPKGGFQREGYTTIGDVSADTIGVDMHFQLTLSAQEAKGSHTYKTKLYTIELPIAIFSATTQGDSTSCATDSTLAPVAG